MASIQQIKRRTQSVKNTRQITKAMELVAASKMRKAQELASQSQLYATSAAEILTRLRQMTNVDTHPLFRRREVKSRLIVAMTSARGLAGAYDSNIIRRMSVELENDRKSSVATKVLVIGKKGANWLSKVRGVDVAGVYDELPDNPTGNDIRPIVATMIDEFASGRVQAVDALFTHYVNSINQVPEMSRLLPAAFEDVEIPPALNDALFEPTPRMVLDRVTQRLVEIQLVQAFLEAFASEQSMRMMAMKNATDNAGEIIDDLTLEYNSARQAAITQELAEITSGAEAIAV